VVRRQGRPWLGGRDGRGQDDEEDGGEDQSAAGAFPSPWEARAGHCPAVRDWRAGGRPERRGVDALKITEADTDCQGPHTVPTTKQQRRLVSPILLALTGNIGLLHSRFALATVDPTVVEAAASWTPWAGRARDTVHRFDDRKKGILGFRPAVPRCCRGSERPRSAPGCG
jgi:hypothetical protein